MFLAGQTSPMIFASAMLNFGVRQLLETLVEIEDELWQKKQQSVDA